MLRFLLPTLAICVCASAHADEGETSFDFLFSPEVATTSHPDLQAAPFSDAATTVFKPRLGAGLRYGLTPDFYVGFSGQLAASTAIKTPKVTIEGSTGDLLTAQYFELSSPLLLGWRFDSGSFISGAVELEAAPLAVFWGTQDLVDFEDLDEQGLPASLEKKAPDTWVVGGLLRLSLLFNMRLFDFVGADIGPNVAFSWTGQPAFHAGLTIRPSLIWGGPL